jgi:glutamine phosphoribosylpyrophosphate amidotransferase
MDVSTTANQPMSDASGDITIVFNSEIYNFKSIREELEKRGRRFKTRPDIEVIIEGCIAWGEDVGDRLRGMFAIFDRRRDRLPLLRDRVGRKALYYTVINNARILGCRHSGKAALRRTRAEIAAQARDGAVPAEGALMYRPKMGFGVPTRIWALLMLEVWFRTRVDANLFESLAASDARLALW